MGAGTQLIEVVGGTYGSRCPATGRKDDIYDFAIVRIDGPANELLLPMAITLSDVFAPYPRWITPHKGLAVFGSRARDFKRHGNTIFIRPQAVESRPLDPSAYQSLQLNPDDHLALAWFNTMYTEKGVVRSGSFAGLSGGGVWLIPELIGEPFPEAAPFHQPKLMGIFIEHRKSRSCLVATRIRHHLELIRRWFPELPVHRLRFWREIRPEDLEGLAGSSPGNAT
jgi:hypothetical protein